MKTMESSKERCNEWFYIYCELSKDQQRAASTRGCSNYRCAVAARGRHHRMTYVICERKHSTCMLGMVNGNVERQTDVSTCVRTVLESDCLQHSPPSLCRS